MIDSKPTTIKKKLAELHRLSARQLQARYAEVFGEPARSGNKQWLLRRIAWRIQMLAEGDLAERAIERARERAKELARDADLRVRPPQVPRATGAGPGHVVTGPMVVRRDERIPPPGTVLTRVFKGHEYHVTVMPKGFEYEGDVYRSLSAVAHAITGSHWNGMQFWGLAARKDRR